MSIWTRCEGRSRLGTYSGPAWRVVEGQHVISTRKLVDSDAEHDLLEEMIESSKPPLTTGRKLHYLLVTPFRYPPLSYGSRFGRRDERGIWYGAEQTRTAFAEVAYYRMLFLAGTTAPIAPLTIELSAFKVQLASDKAIDLTVKPFDTFRESISSKTDYAGAQEIGTAMRTDGVELFKYVSARDHEQGACIGLFAETPFQRDLTESQLQRWLCVATPRRVEISRTFLRAQESLCFPREEFEVDGALPAPGLVAR